MTGIMYDKMMRKLRQGGNEITTEDQSNLTNEQRIQALANISDQTANANTGKMGYKVLLPGKSFAEQVTEANTIYEIRDVFDLGGTQETPVSVTLPANSVLKFDGGIIKNCTVSGSNTRIEAGNVKIFDNVKFSGTFVDSLNAIWVGANPGNSSFDNSAIIQDWFDSYSSCFKRLYFPQRNYYFLSTAWLKSDVRNLTLDGCHSTFYTNIPDDNNGNGQYFIKCSSTSSSGSSGEEFCVKSVRILNNRTTSGYNISKTRCFYFDRTQRFILDHVQVWYFDIAIFLRDIWYGAVRDNVVLRNNRIGVVCWGGNYYETNTVSLTNVTFSGVSANACKSMYPQNDGESDYNYNMRVASCGVDSYTLMGAFSLNGCTFEGFDYGVRLSGYKRSSHATTSGGPLNITGCYFENNRTYDIYVGTGNRDNYGIGSYYMNYIHYILITGCRFFTLKKVCLCGAKATMLSNEPCEVYITTTSYTKTHLDYNGPVTITGSNELANRIGSSLSVASVNENGSTSQIATNFQWLYATRDNALTWNRFNNYSLTGAMPASVPRAFGVANFITQPVSEIALDILPLRYYRDIRNNGYARLMVPSGNSIAAIACNPSYQIAALNCQGNITLAEFIRIWKAGTSYTGTVQNLYPYTITANPTEGTVKNESGTLVGFGVNAIGSLISDTSAAQYNIFIDAMVVVRISYSRMKFYCDLIQNGRTYDEFIRSRDEAQSYTSYIGIYGAETSMQYVMKRINSVYYDTTNSKLKIFNGYEWVDMTSPFQRYYYVSSGSKLSQRMAMPDYVGQTYHNMATGITYVFGFANGIGRSSYWNGGIGKVSSLEHPNGYIYDNTLDYANELEAGEQVIYNGKIFTWNGTSFDGNDTYSVTNTLASVTNSNPATEIDGNKTYMATLTPGLDYVIQSVTVTMGGTDVTSFVYNPTTHVIYIASVTGDIVITATAGTPN